MNEDQIKTIGRFICPLAVFLSPLYPAILVFAYFRDKANGRVPSLLDPYLVGTLAGWAIFTAGCVWFCKQELGWFQKK